MQHQVTTYNALQFYCLANKNQRTILLLIIRFFSEHWKSMGFCFQVYSIPCLIRTTFFRKFRMWHIPIFQCKYTTQSRYCLKLSNAIHCFSVDWCHDMVKTGRNTMYTCFKCKRYFNKFSVLIFRKYPNIIAMFGKSVNSVKII